MEKPDQATARLRASREKSVVIQLSVSQSTFDSLVRMRKAKKLQYEQEVVRILVAEGLDRAGFL